MTVSPTSNVVEILKLRASWLKKIRTFFDSRGFIEVQTPILSRDTVVDRFIDPIPVSITLQDVGTQQFWLQTSPEFGMKRLLAAGAQAIYQITPAFRAGEMGSHHNIEFTILEWYRVGDDYFAGMDLLDQFSQSLLDQPPALRMTYRDAFMQFSNIDPFAMNADKGASVENSAETWDEQLNYQMATSVEPALSDLSAVILYDWPASQAALARLRSFEEDGRSFQVAERFELYINGIELANGYHELTDPVELLQRNERVNQMRTRANKPALPNHSRLIDAMRTGLPDCSGTALGFDRMLMLVTQADHISQVGAIPANEA